MPKTRKKFISIDERICKFFQLKRDVVMLILITGTVSAIIFHYSRFAFVGDYAPKLDSFLQAQINIFCDFYSIFSGYVVNKYNVSMNYLPGVFVPLSLLAKFCHKNPYVAVRVLLIMYLASISTYVFMGLRGINIINKTVLTYLLITCNYSVLFTLDTANFEMLCFLLVAYGIYLHIRSNNVWSGILIGISASVKLYPAAFLFSILNKENKKSILTGFLLGFTLFIVLAFSIDGSVSKNFITWSSVFKTGLSKYKGMMIYSYNGQFFGNSIMNAFRVIVGPAFNIRPILPTYYAFSLICMVIILSIARYTRYLYMRVTMIASAICLFAPTSQDYKLLYFIIPLLLLLRSYRIYKQDLYFCIFISLLFIPKTYITFYGSNYVTINTLLNASLMIALLLMSMWLSIFDRRFSRLPIQFFVHKDKIQKPLNIDIIK